ncbi:MAG: hypothetical protein DI598_21080 [Pseudopedobacter saltans]|uniref:Uncharacterized protein n=1 Tax=Pseudopedobacter saltans TaxID=151895 RepID=A0A2W5G410_9SPHI|nr:MAG: hypothetical protein DI598_21080 [Pseudopedobacter saltans]
MKKYLGFPFAIFLLSIGSASHTLAQTKDLKTEEKKLVAICAQMFPENDSTQFYSEEFEKRLSNIVKKNPSSISYPFNQLIQNNDCYIKTSSDGNFRIYSWDSHTGGTMVFYRVIYQWKSNGKVLTDIPPAEEGDPKSFCSQIFTVDIKGKSYYLVVTNGNYSTMDAKQSIVVYSIEGNKLSNTAKLFKTKTKSFNKIDVSYDFFSVKDRSERPLELIKYDDKQKTVYIPVVGEKGNVTDKNLLYQLKGDYFEYIGVK